MSAEKVDATLRLAMKMACDKVEQLGELNELESDDLEDLKIAVGTIYKVIKAKKKLIKLQEKCCKKDKADKDEDKDEDKD